MSDSSKAKKRPLAPHLQVYKPQLTSVMSITHRATGYALAIGTIVLTWMLLAVAIGPEAYAVFLSFAGSSVGEFLLYGWSLALFYHLCNGVRHLLWDMGYLFKIENAYKAGYVVLVLTVMLTIFFWWSIGNTGAGS